MAVSSLKNKTKLSTLTSPFDIDLGGMIPLSTVAVTSSTATVSFTGIPQSYEHLQIRYLVRTNRSDVQDIIRFRFNGDSGSNYAWHQLRGTGDSVDVNSGTSTSSPWTAIVAGNNAGSNMFGTGITDILDYSNTNKNTTVRTLSGVEVNTTDGRLGIWSNLWLNTNAITSIEIAPNFGTTISANSHFALYGIKRAGV